MRITLALSFALCLGTVGCDRGHPGLDPDDGRRRLRAYHIEASGGTYRDTAGLQVEFRRQTADLVRAVGPDGETLATFRWTGDEWRMEPDPRLAARLGQIDHDREEVRALAALVDSVESNLTGFERELTAILRNARDARSDSGPWQWRLAQAAGFLEEMQAYLERLRRRSRRTAGADGVVIRLEDLLRRVREAGGRVDRARSESGG